MRQPCLAGDVHALCAMHCQTGRCMTWANSLHLEHCYFVSNALVNVNPEGHDTSQEWHQQAPHRMHPYGPAWTMAQFGLYFLLRVHSYNPTPFQEDRSLKLVQGNTSISQQLSTQLSLRS